MPNWQTLGFGSLMVWGALAFIGCSSTAVTPEFSTGAPAELAEIVVRPEAIPVVAMSSLEALQRGESTATPASSPLRDIYFDFDSYDVSSEMREMLKANAAWLREIPL
jgi:outer membrane protein OmpA-like peptidoglycan-associated protein